MLKSLLGLIKNLFAIRLGPIAGYFFALFGTAVIVLGPEFLYENNSSPEDESVPDNLKQIYEVITGPQDFSFFIVLATVCILGPIIEELIFRGLLWGLIGRMIDGHYALFVTSILFAAAHGTPEHIVAVFPIGLWIGLLRLGSNSIFPSIIAHILNNSIISAFIIMS